MTGYTVHTGSSVKFSSGWDLIFQGSKSKNTEKAAATKKQTTKAKTVKKAAKKAAKKATAKTAKKAPAKKAAKRGK